MRDEELTKQYAGGPLVRIDTGTPVKYGPAACPMLTEGRLACPAAGCVWAHTQVLQLAHNLIF